MTARYLVPIVATLLTLAGCTSSDTDDTSYVQVGERTVLQYQYDGQQMEAVLKDVTLTTNDEGCVGVDDDGAFIAVNWPAPVEIDGEALTARDYSPMLFGDAIDLGGGFTTYDNSDVPAACTGILVFTAGIPDE